MKRIFNNLSIKSRMTVLLVVVALLSSFIIGTLGWRNGQVSLETAIVNQLTTVRQSKTLQIENYFYQTFSHIVTMAESRMMVNAVKQFQEGFNVGLNRSLSDEEHAAVSAFYENEFIPELNRSGDIDALPALYRPRREVTSYFQYHYIADNPYKVGEKGSFVEAEKDDTFYSRFHKVYHPLLRNIQLEFEYYDLFLIDTTSLNIVYSVSKESDFATSLVDGPYSESALGVLARKIKEQPERGITRIVDYRPYAPSYGAPAAFIGAPIFDGNEAIGILALQLPVDRINSVMTNRQNWSQTGLGDSGESYLVGPDQFMRSVSRSYVEDPDGYLNLLRRNDVLESTINNIEKHRTSVLFQPVVSESVSEAIEGNSGTHRATNYLGVPVLSSYGELNIQGLNWIIVSEMGEVEAFQPITNLLRNILVWGVVLVLAVAFMAMVLARLFVRPIEKLTQGVHAMASGDMDAHIDLESKDEFGDLAESFNYMADTIQRKTGDTQRLREENQRFLENILPLPIAKRVKDGEFVADKLQQVSVVCLRFDGFNDYSNSVGTAEAVRQLSTLYDRVDQIGEQYDVESFKIIGNTYIGACGVTLTRLDHSKRAIEFTIAVMKLLQSRNAELSTQLTLNAGIDSGAVSAGVIGTNRFSYEIWGDPVSYAQELLDIANGNHITVSETAHNRLKSFFTFTSRQSNADDGKPAYSLDMDMSETTTVFAESEIS